jgi:cytochrome c oxidase subunit 2
VVWKLRDSPIPRHDWQPRPWQIAVPGGVEPDTNPRYTAETGRLFVEGADTAMLTPKLVFKKLIGILSLCVALAAGSSAALAAAAGHPEPWQFGLQKAATPVMDDIVWFHNFLSYLIVAIAVFVLVLLVYVCVRFNARANPTPSRTTHNTLIEVIWTVVPVLILVSIAVPSFRLLFLQLDIPKADLTIKATGKQWFWSYEYPDQKIAFDSVMVQTKDLKQGQPRLLTVDNQLVVPVNKVVRVQTTGADVIHSFAVPSFGIKIDAIPGRLNETWFKAEREGIYYGQCSELCGRDHAFMPIAVHVMNDKDYAAWLDQAKKKFAMDDDSRPTNVAAAETGR